MGMTVKAFTALSRSTSKPSANTATNRDRVIVVSFVLFAVVVVVAISCLLACLVGFLWILIPEGESVLVS